MKRNKKKEERKSKLAEGNCRVGELGDAHEQPTCINPEICISLTWHFARSTLSLPPVSQPKRQYMLKLWVHYRRIMMYTTLLDIHSAQNHILRVNDICRIVKVSTWHYRVQCSSQAHAHSRAKSRKRMGKQKSYIYSQDLD